MTLLKISESSQCANLRGMGETFRSENESIAVMAHGDDAHNGKQGGKVVVLKVAHSAVRYWVALVATSVEIGCQRCRSDSGKGDLERWLEKVPDDIEGPSETGTQELHSTGSLQASFPPLSAIQDRDSPLLFSSSPQRRS